MIDRKNAVLTVREVVIDEYDPEIVLHVMEKTHDLHFHCTSLIGENGQEYSLELYQRRKDDEGNIEYQIEFEDKSLRFPVGTVFHLGPEEWRKEIPKCRLNSISYHSACCPPEFDDNGNVVFTKYDEVGIVVSAGGEVTLFNSGECSAENCFEEGARLNINPERVEILFKDLLRCFSEVDCYQEKWSDDTGRDFTLTFCNGKSLQYSGVFCHDEYEKVTTSEEIIRTFIAECQALLASRNSIVS